MPFKEHTLLRSSVEIHIYCPDAADAVGNENAVVMRTVKMFDIWFGNTVIEEHCPSFEECEKAEIQVVFIVLSFCTTEKLDMKIQSVISYARELAKEIGRDRVDMFVNDRVVSI